MKILKGEKVYIQEGLKEEDYPLILSGYTNLEVINFVNFAKQSVAFKTVEEAKSFALAPEEPDQLIFGIYTYEDAFIGYTTLSEFKEKTECEFAIFILNKQYWVKGIGAEVTRLILDYAFNGLGIEKVVLTTSEYHEKAIALYERIGFKKTKLIPNDREIFLNGKWVLSGTVEMEIKKSEFGKLRN